MRTFKIEKTDTQCVVTWRHYPTFLVFKWSMFLVLWSFLCIFPLDMMLNEDVLHGILSALIVWGFWFYALGLIINAFFGETRFVLNENGLESTWTCLSLKQEKQIALCEIRCFDKYGVFGKTVFYGKAARWHRPLYVVCNDRRVSFRTTNGFLTVSGKELDDLCDQLNAFLETLKAQDQET